MPDNSCFVSIVAGKLDMTQSFSDKCQQQCQTAGPFSPPICGHGVSMGPCILIMSFGF